MVDGHSLGDLTVAVGDRVRASGFLERGIGANGWELWVVDPWRPERHRRLANGSVEVHPRADSAVRPGSVVASGVWDGAAIREAVIEQRNVSPVRAWQSAAAALAPGELGAGRYRELTEQVQAAVAGRVIASGGTDSALWFHVLSVTPELAALGEAFPTRVDVFAAVAPATWAL